MGYVSKDIAVITEPKVVTLSAVPNFVQFASKPATKKYVEANISINFTPDTPGNLESISTVNISQITGGLHSFHGTINVNDVQGNVFFISTDVSETAENLRQSLLSDPWINANFDLTIPFVWSGDTPQNGNVINLKSKGAGANYNFAVYYGSGYTFRWVNQYSQNNDSISGEESTAEIDLDVYLNPSVFLGEDDKPTTTAKIGTYAMTLQKTYAGVPLWFNLNGLFGQYGNYNRMPGVVGWFDTGTAQAYRFVAKVKGVNSYPFYQSNALFVLNGYGPASEELDLSQYVYQGDTVKLLTNKPRTTYTRGQKEYLNFILSDPQRGEPNPTNFTLCLVYRAYSTGETYMGTMYGQNRSRANFSVVNTCQLDIDAVLDKYPGAGIIKVSLGSIEANYTRIVSNDLEYTVRPDCLHTLRQFSFLNRLGGWDAFNFDSSLKDEIKTTVETYGKTITPSYQKGDSVETVYNAKLANTFTVEGAPVTDDVAAWLKELAAARVILDNDGNYVIIEDFNLQVTDANKNMQKPTIKYRLSE